MSLRARLTGRGAKRILALGLGFLLVEVAVMPLVVMSSSLHMRGWLPAPLSVLGQSSKAGLLPRDYVLLLGDSNAEGHGDWLTEALATGERNPPFHSAHVIHERTGQDVISFGRGGAGSVAGIAYMVEKRFTALWRTGLGRPREVLIYFYEGNDPTDNIQEGRRRFGLGDRRPESYADEEWDELIASQARRGRRKGLPGALFTPYLILNAIKGGTAGGRSGAASAKIARYVPSTTEPPPATNLMRIGEELYHFDEGMQSPALELTKEELAFALGAFEASIRWARDRFADSHVTIVYIPSPLSCYEIVSPRVWIQRYDKEREEYYPTEDVQHRSEFIRGRVKTIAGELKVDLLDLTPGLRDAAAGELLHGPGDGKHFNRAGYTQMGEIIARDALGLPR